MTDTTQAFFERLAERGYEPLLHSISGTIRWDIEDTGSWFVVVNNGSLTASRDTAGADCVLACSREDFDRMVLGKQNPNTLFMQGKMKITGNLGLALIFQRLFPDESLSGTAQGKIERQ
ncbi:MAG TPA: SCP2 sterol-binding domain-containing protein [Ktedonobacteraceae bacterium]